MKSLGWTFLILFAACGSAEADKSVTTGGEKDGLVVVIAPAKRRFTPQEPLSFTVTYRNVSKHAFRLPDQPGLWNYWQLNLKEMAAGKPTGKTYVGKTSLPMGLRVPARPSDPIKPHKTLSIEVKLSRYKYSAEKWDRRAAATQLPPGKYQVTIDIHFPEKPAGEVKPPPVWEHDSITSQPVEIEIGSR
jgi:hypothetical protein